MPNGLSALLVPPLVPLSLSSSLLPAQAASALLSGTTAAAASAPRTMERRLKVLIGPLLVLLDVHLVLPSGGVVLQA